MTADGEFSPRTVPSYYDSPMPQDRASYRRKSFNGAGEPIDENSTDFADPSIKDREEEMSPRKVPTGDSTVTATAAGVDSLANGNKFAASGDMWTSPS